MYLIQKNVLSKGQMHMASPETEVHVYNEAVNFILAPSRLS